MFEASAIILPIHITAHWKPSFWVMDVTVRKLVAGSERTGNASKVVRAKWAFVIDLDQPFCQRVKNLLGVNRLGLQRTGQRVIKRDGVGCQFNFEVDPVVTV